MLRESYLICSAREQSAGRKIWLEILIFLAVFFVTNMAESVVLELPLIADAMHMLFQIGDVTETIWKMIELVYTQKYLLLQLYAAVLTTAGTILYCVKIEKRSLVTMGFVRKNAIKEYFIGLAIGFGLFAAAYLLCMITGTVKIRLSGGNFGTILLFLLGYLLQGMSEEVLLRGYFCISLARRNHVAWAIVISSVMFALLHLANPGITVLAILNIALFGALMAVYMLKRENIWGVCAIHSAWNFVQGNVFGVQVSGTALSRSLFSTELTGNALLTGGAFGLEGGLAVTVVLLAALCFLMITGRSKTNAKNPQL